MDSPLPPPILAFRWCSACGCLSPFVLGPTHAAALSPFPRTFSSFVDAHAHLARLFPRFVLLAPGPMPPLDAPALSSSEPPIHAHSVHQETSP